MSNRPKLATTIYALVPAQPLPEVDLSKSFKGRILPPKVHNCIRRHYFKYDRQFLFCAMVSYCLNIAIAMVTAPTGKIFALVSVFLWAPLGLGSVTTLRYDIVRLVCRTFDFWFFSITTSVIVITTSVYFSDLRWARMLIDWFGFHHVICVDAHVFGLRHLTCIMIVGIFSIAVLLTWIFLGRVDGGSTFTILEYENEHNHFELSGVDVIGSGLISLGFLLAKISFRKRKVFGGRKTRPSIVECVVYRCRLKLESTEGPKLANAWPMDNSKYNSKEDSLRQPDAVQHLMFLKFPRTFDATETLLPWRLAQHLVIPVWGLAILYAIGVTGILLSHVMFVHKFDCSDDSLWHKHILSMTSSIALACTLVFMATFAVFYQRQLLKFLFHSFDFAFYSFQITSANICVCTFYRWDTSHCVMVLSWWLLAHWVFTLDALTPIIRDALKFRVIFPAAVMCLLLIDHTVIMYRIFITGDRELQDSVIFEATVWDQHMIVRVVPFYASRILTLVLWCSRLVIRLSLSSIDEVTILRGTVCYDNYFANGRRSSTLLEKVPEGQVIKTEVRCSQVSPAGSALPVYPK